MLLSQNAVKYACRQLAQRAGIQVPGGQGTGFERLNCDFVYGLPPATTPGRPTIVVRPHSDGQHLCSADSPDAKSRLLPLRDVLPPSMDLGVQSPVPILFWGSGANAEAPFAELRGRVLVFNADVIAATLCELTRWEESVSTVRDKHGRFPATASRAFQQGYLSRPVIDEYGLIIQSWLRVLVEGWRPARREFGVLISHDIDSARQYRAPKHALRSAGYLFLRRGDVSQGLQTLRDAVNERIWPSKSECLRMVEGLAESAVRHRLKTAFYFMAAESGPLESDYDIESPAILGLIRKLLDRGCEVGLHASYASFGCPERLATEKDRLERVAGIRALGGRQHFLRFAPSTWRHWSDAGLAYDSTVGYHDHEGFRCGTCLPFHPYDLEADRELDVLEVPLIVMDATLRRYRRLTPNQAGPVIFALIERCRAVGGMFAMLLHNQPVHDSDPWRVLFERVLRRLGEAA